MLKNDIQILDVTRDPITKDEMLKMAAWAWGDEGEWLARLWIAFNDAHFGGKLEPLPLWQVATFPHGGAIGMFTAGKERSLSIQLKLQVLGEKYKKNVLPEKIPDAAERGRYIRKSDRLLKPGVLLHEMIHQHLFESGQHTGHRGQPWCDEIMRLSKDIWNRDIWASPSRPTKEKNDEGDWVSVRKAKKSPDGKESLSGEDIARWPHSLDLIVPVECYRL